MRQGVGRLLLVEQHRGVGEARAVEAVVERQRLRQRGLRLRVAAEPVQRFAEHAQRRRIVGVAREPGAQQGFRPGRRVRA